MEEVAHQTVGSPLSDGAEATVVAESYLGLEAIRKTRVSKAYRAETFDRRIRSERLRAEVRLLREARRMGLRTPHVFDIDEAAFAIIMERIPGRTLTEVFTDGKASQQEVLGVAARLGEALGKLHAGGMSHGDLTGSNVVWNGKDIAFIDMSMGSRTPEREDFGIDLHLVEEDFNTLLPDPPIVYQAFLHGYALGNPSGAKKNTARAREIKGRVRYS